MRDELILLLEDELLIAMDLEHTLREAGFSNIHISSSCKDANNWLEGNTPSIGILDLHLNDGDCASIARTLRDRFVPFVICSGSTKGQGDFDGILLKGEWLEKPTPPLALVTAIEAHVARSDSGSE